MSVTRLAPKLSNAASARRLGRQHPLAAVAARHCRGHDGIGALIGGVACGPCWELAIRDDEKFAVEHDLPRELDVDPTHIDEIAVELACRGERVDLTPVELAEAVAVLTRRGLSPWQIADRLHTSVTKITDTIAGTADTARPHAACLPTTPSHPITGAA